MRFPTFLVVVFAVVIAFSLLYKRSEGFEESLSGGALAGIAIASILGGLLIGNLVGNALARGIIKRFS